MTADDDGSGGGDAAIISAPSKRIYRKKNPKVARPVDEAEGATGGAATSSAGAKRKRSVPGKLKQPDNAAILHRAPSGKRGRNRGLDNLPQKRPRGRPPLGAKSYLAMPTKTLGLGIGLGASRGYGGRQSMDSLSSVAFKPFLSSEPAASSSSAAADGESGKIQRPHASLVTHRILTRLMTEGPLTVSDLTGSAPDGPTREVVQSILDVLQVTQLDSGGSPCCELFMPTYLKRCGYSWLSR
jgi:hypothetical protein